MKIPEKVRIGGVEYEVRREANVRRLDHLCYGTISFEEDVIRLSTSEDMGHQRSCVTLWHEILHGILYHAGTGVALDEETEEAVVTVLAKGLYQVLQDNVDRFYQLWDSEEEALVGDLQKMLHRIEGCVEVLEAEMEGQVGEHEQV